MKHTSLAILIALVGVMGIRTAAFAQQVPISPLGPISHQPLHAPVSPTSNLRSILAAKLPAAAVQTPAHVSATPASPVVSLNVNHGAYLLPSAQNIVIHQGLQPIVPNPSAPAAPVVPPAPSSANGNNSGSNNSNPYGGTITGYYPVQAPVVQTYQYEAPAAPAYVAPSSGTTFHVKAKPVYVYEKLSLPADTSTVTPADLSSQPSLGASTYNLGTHITLIEVMLALAALLALMVGAKEYQARKRAAQIQAQQSYGHIMYA